MSAARDPLVPMSTEDAKVINRLDGTVDRVVLRGEALRRWQESQSHGESAQ
jgi:hypothetical protein